MAEISVDRPFDMALNYGLKVLRMDRNTLKEKQSDAITSFMGGNDTMIILPTGYGKSLVYQAAPFCSDYLIHSRHCSCDEDSHILQKSIAIVLSPLTALMSDQVKDLTQRGISAVNAACVKSEEEKSRLKEGNYSVVFATPETLLKSGTGLLHSAVYRDNVCGIFVDEGHCVAKWGLKDGKVSAFRKKYSRLAELRSFLKSSTPMCCLTATASTSIANIITTSLGLTTFNTIRESPERPNIRYSVVEFNNNIDDNFRWLQQEMSAKRGSLPKTLIFCKTKRNCSRIHASLTSLCEDIEPYVAIFHADTPEKRKDDILKDFVALDSTIRVLLATSAFGMGVNVQNLYTVVHYGPPRDFDDYFQESGRVGRDGRQSYTVLMNYRGRGKGVVKPEMRNYVQNKSGKCRRNQLLEHYGESSEVVSFHDCCDVCAFTCTCGEDSTCVAGGGVGWAETLMVATKEVGSSEVKYQRSVSEDEREMVRGMLHQYQQSLIDNESDGHLYTGASIASGFPDQLIDFICTHLHTIGNKEDLGRRFPFFNSGHVQKVWFIIDQLCESQVHEVDIDSSSESDSSSSESEFSLGDIDSDDMEIQQEIIQSQYSRVTLSLSESSDDSSED